MKIKFLKLVEGRFPLYLHFSHLSSPQPAYIYVSIETGEVWAEYGSENGLSPDVFNNRTIRLPINPETPSWEIERILKENKSMFQKIVDESKIVWNGYNWVGVISEQNREMIDQFECNYFSQFTMISEDYFVDWLGGNVFPDKNQSIADFVNDLLLRDGDGDCYFDDYLKDNPKAILELLENLWEKILYQGSSVPDIVFQHMLKRENNEI